jgi:alkyl hydroperoxide reductase subunit AhpC
MDSFNKNNRLDEKDVNNLNANDELTTGIAFNSRTAYIIGPKFQSKHHIRMILQYPFTVGFNTGEVLRVIDALQLSDSAWFDYRIIVQIL